ncbi:monovalent cation/H+ antiporter complex subunit F [Salicibibacter halophilus]|uniref:monovalent cation/H+ antiporter complex subunit F n=1 Tax=Salicibibacter halophilus TaxID=2502791 RepID=UPI0029C74F5F|nr:monovalent cation/H+ antiporter complex subunit F [Salicibibacter halophilus]
MIFETIMIIFLSIKSLAIFLCLIRVILGPTMADRALALDTVGLLLIGFVGSIMIIHETIAYADVVVVIAILACLGSIAIAKYLERGVIFDRY